jgi:hypothetical protein
MCNCILSTASYKGVFHYTTRNPRVSLWFECSIRLADPDQRDYDTVSFFLAFIN